MKHLLQGITDEQFKYASLFVNLNGPNRAARRMVRSPRFWRKIKAGTMSPGRRYPQ